MGKVQTNNEMEISLLEARIKGHLDVIPYCTSREDALEIQKEIELMEEEIERLREIEDEVCPECGSYETEWGEDADELSCRNSYHEGT
jgi:hypothetical protein